MSNMDNLNNNQVKKVRSIWPKVIHTTAQSSLVRSRPPLSQYYQKLPFGVHKHPENLERPFWCVRDGEVAAHTSYGPHSSVENRLVSVNAELLIA
jgi:hypothetical protein